MKAVILAGGLGTRLSEETSLKPKPMVEIGGMPVLWHIMKIYSYYGINDFIICLGYKGYVIKEYFANYFLHMSDVTFCMRENKMEVHHKKAEPWSVTLVDTGPDTMTGGRLKRIKDYLTPDEPFCFTYGDGVADINIKSVIDLHNKGKRLSTVTAVQPAGRFGALDFAGNKVNKFQEKPKGDGSWINGGFFVLSPAVIGYVEDDKTVWEQEPMQKLAENGEMSCYFHKGFWQPMDTLREKHLLEKLWQSGKAPWKMWNE
ncbi:glucose-1-phosphate cytidylyltransferase [Cysteiniphilum halobium]|uniref:glucose-1-phosphate cytidylyltransferase n=1 Tax=Cysteiniphilum halobium TaxID=2219059 RepID=UPI000E6533C2|nr:glucose-1-phosphate cytidylyltransferase [Cysteiniphilum halobium]